MGQTSKNIETLYQAESAALLRYIRRCGGRGASEDLLHETFVQLLKKPEELRDARSPKAWLYSVARHIVLGFVRKQSRIVELLVDPPSPSIPAEDDRIQMLKTAMERLPPQQLEVLELRLDAELSYGEIADALDIPVGTVRSRLHHAVRALRTAIVGKEMDHG
jgi:RNA polymerase sigma-70 factor (ECF subfamily)